MNRRKFAGMLGAAGAASMSLPHLKSFAQPGEDPPNVILVILEDLNDWVGCMGGHMDSITPNLDAFAAGGTLFTNCHASAPACNPARTAMLSGLQPYTSGVYQNQDDWRDYIDASRMLPQQLMNAGYHTARIGKVYHGGYQVNDHWDDIFKPSNTHDLGGPDPYLPNHPFHGMHNAINSSADFHWGPSDNPEADFWDYQVMDYTTNQLQSGLPEPFFLAVGTRNVHYPAIVPRRYFERFNLQNLHVTDVNFDDLNDVPPAAQALVESWRLQSTIDHKNFHKAIQAYLASINYVDDLVGWLLNSIAESAYADNTAVIVLADHGQHLGEKTHWRKWTLWEESSLAYCAWQVPGLTTPGGVCREAVSLVDVYPTLGEICDVTLPENDGLSLVPQLMNPVTPRAQPAIITHDPGNFAVRDERFRYIQYAEGGEELYDHDADPNEWYNLANDPDYQGIKAQLAGWVPPGGVVPWTKKLRGEAR
ncbi:sulfatase [bacterium]|nr:sulfatase [bacterium]